MMQECASAVSVMRHFSVSWRWAALRLHEPPTFRHSGRHCRLEPEDARQRPVQRDDGAGGDAQRQEAQQHPRRGDVRPEAARAATLLASRGFRATDTSWAWNGREGMASQTLVPTARSNCMMWSGHALLTRQRRAVTQAEPHVRTCASWARLPLLR